MKIAIVGPESSGKTTICEALAKHYGAPSVEEIARAYLTERGGVYHEADLLQMSWIQAEVGSMREREAPDAKVIFHDTDMITFKIWSAEKYGRVHEEIERSVKEVQYDHWLLCRPDIPWEPDPIRENPHDRDRLFSVYEATLTELQRPYTILEGTHKKRMKAATKVIDKLIK